MKKCRITRLKVDYSSSILIACGRSRNQSFYSGGILRFLAVILSFEFIFLCVHHFELREHVHAVKYLHSYFFVRFGILHSFNSVSNSVRGLVVNRVFSLT